jgi:UV DNA damage endonuclease
MYSLCCISNSLSEQGHKFQTMTWARFSKLPREEAVATLSARTLNNIRVTYKILEQCVSEGWGYRVSSNLFPLLTYDVAELKLEDYPDYIDIEAALADCASIIKDKSIRVSCHPDQFNVLASEGKHNVAKTIKELNHHGWLMDMLGAPRDYRAPINIHINNTKGDPADIAARFMANLAKCDESVQSRLVVENEDKGIWTPSLLVKHFDIPITYDNLHHKCLPDDLTQEQAHRLCYKTWMRGGYYKPLFHYSESHPNKTNPRSHADMPTATPASSFDAPVDYDIELKSKDYAIASL